MNTPSLTLAHLEQLLGLTRKKHAISLELEAIEKKIAAVFSGEKPGRTAKAPARRGRPPGKEAGGFKSTAAPRKGSKKIKRGGLKDAIMAALTGAGAGGLSLGEVAEKIGAKKNAVGVWFYTTGKKVAGLKKVGRGRFAIAR